MAKKKNISKADNAGAVQKTVQETKTVTNKPNEKQQSILQKQIWKKHNQWNKKNYESLTVMLPHGTKKRIAEASKAAGKSQRQYIIQAIEAEMEKTIANV